MFYCVHCIYNILDLNEESGVLTVKQHILQLELNWKEKVDLFLQLRLRTLYFYHIIRSKASDL